ncbi:serine/threonine kinase [Calothrix parasitica NIES-267]|uniref:non-specific serine/threonine protein kinase n=1 Tax=Calothrix parasitica NIES-267 TaxID=1973488 RepID=A0A1Z4M002_9CYAN|nr:serine/threonine kinase [Calothrix parasitica NIES-267]
MLLNNRYQIIRTLGSGGFGETVLAEDTQMPSRRPCVIKQLRPIQHNPKVYQLVRERFGREAATLEELGDNSPQIPTLYAYFSDNGQFYLVQEYIQGKTLTQVVEEQGLMDENSVKQILISILPVLEYVHSKGIVHRDIKPENILIDAEGKPVLIDFGAVKETLSTLLTPSGNATKSIVIGTPGFMATEQSVGRPMFASDIYSLGMTVIYLVTGKRPQELTTEPETGKVLWRQYAPNIKDNFADILDKAIGFDARERFKTASAMLKALQTGILGLPSEVLHTGGFSDTVAPGVTLLPQTYLNTVAIPPTSSVSSNNGNGKGILLGSLIVGSLIGASIIVGFALNKQPKQVQTVTQQPQATIPEPTPQKSSKTQTTPTPNPEPIIKPAFTAPATTSTDVAPQVEAPLRRPQNPQTINPAPDVVEIPQTTDLSPPGEIEPPVEPPAKPPIQQPSPAKTVENYYLNINQGQYKTAWNQLSAEFKDNKGLHPNGYFSYLSWWRGKVKNVNIQQINILEANVDTATVDASLDYLMKNGRIINQSVRFFLSWDEQNRRWVVRDAT